MKRRAYRLLTIGHPYAMRMSRRLPNEMAKAGGADWDVLAVGPAFYHGDPKYADLEPSHLVVYPGESARIAGMPMFFNHNPHLAFWGDAVRRLLRDDFDVVHCWDEPFNPLCAQVAKLAPAKAAFAFYTFQNIHKKYPPPFNFLERYSLKRCDGWIPAGALVEQTLAERTGYRDRPHRIMGLGVDVDEFSPSVRAREAVRAECGWSVDPHEPVIGFLGRFTEAKGVRILMRALDRIDRPWRMLFVGSGDLEPEIATWSRRYPGRVAVKKNLAHAEVSRHLNACDVLCAPSQTTPVWKEQFGRMLIEAFACGVAVVTSDSGEIPYVVGDAAVVVPERDEQRWYEELARMIDQPERRAAFAALGLARVRERFAWSALARRHLDFFEELIERRASLA